MSNLFNRVIDDIEINRNRKLKGLDNCIPWGLPRFETLGNPGIQQGKYYIITANSKVGKTQITDWLFLYNAYNFIKETNSNIKLKIFYFSLEMSAEEKLRQALSNRLYLDSKGKIRVTPTKLRSIGKKDVLPEDILTKVKTYGEYFDEFTKTVTFIDSIRNPTGIYNFMRDYANRNGVQHKKKILFEDKSLKGDTTTKEVEVDDYYEPYDPDEYVVVIIDHARLLQIESQNGAKMDLRETIAKMSSHYNVLMRNKWNYIPVLIQQQAASQESIENAKFDKLRPTLDGLGDNKATQQDANIILGLFSPFRHKITTYEGYNITKFKDHIRFFEILGGREGGGGITCPLYFDGAVNYFRELPLPDRVDEINMIYNKIEDMYKIDT
jgi:hypothetical protein